MHFLQKNVSIVADLIWMIFRLMVRYTHSTGLGTGRTLSGTPIHTYGMGSPGAGMSINQMVKLPFRFTEQELQKLIRK